jgi:hypothetical protein
MMFREALPEEHVYQSVIQDRDSIFSRQLDTSVKQMHVALLRTPVRAPKSELDLREIREFSAINRLIHGSGDGQAKGVILFQSGFYSGGEGAAREFGSWERPTSRAGPPQ